MAFNVNVPDTDLVDLDNVILDLNQLEVLRKVADVGSDHCILFLKNGHSYVFPINMYEKLRPYCRQS